MRVLHVVPSIARSYGGPVYSLFGFLAAGRSAGIQGEVAAPATSNDDARYFDLAAPGVPLHLFRTFGKDAFIVSPALQAWLEQELHRFDVVHIYGLLNGVCSLAARTCRLRGQPFIIHPCGTLSRYTFEHRRRTIKRIYFQLLDRPNVEQASSVHFTTAAEKQGAAWHGLDWGSRAQVVSPPLLDHATSVPAPARESRRGTRVLLLARLNPVKRIESLIEAWPLILRQIPEARLAIAGSGEPAYRESLESKVDEIGLRDSVTFTGFVAGAEKQRLFMEADVFVLPSFHENFGVVIVEALAAGIPVVLTPEVQLSSFVADNGLGIVTSAATEDLADAIVRALGDDTLRRTCAEVAPALVAEAFSVGTTGALLKRMYEDAVASAREGVRR